MWSNNLEYYLTLTDIKFDQNALNDFWELIKPKVLESYHFQSDEIQDGIDKTEKWNGRRLNNSELIDKYLGFGYDNCLEIKRLLELFNKDFQLTIDDFCFVAYEPGFEFFPHIDEGRKVYVAFPVTPSDGGVPINFYEKIIHEDGGIQCGQLVETYNYSTIHPTLVDVTKFHGVKNDNNWRVYLQLDMGCDAENITFEDCKKRLKEDKFYNKGEIHEYT